MAQPFKKYSSYIEYLNDVNDGIFNEGNSIQYIYDESASKNIVVFRQGTTTSSKVLDVIDYSIIKDTEQDLQISEWIANTGQKITNLGNKINEQGLISLEELETYKENFPNYYLAFIGDENIDTYEQLPICKILINEYNISPDAAYKYALIDDTTSEIIGYVKLDDINPSGKETSEFYYSIGCLSDVHHDVEHDNNYYQQGDPESGPQAASDLNNALHYFETNKKVKFITISGDLTVQQGDSKDYAFIFNNFPYENGNDPGREYEYKDWDGLVTSDYIHCVVNDSESGSSIEGQTFTINNGVYDFIFTSGGQRTLILQDIIPNISDYDSCISVTCNLIYNGEDVTSIFEEYYNNVGLNYIPIGFYSANDEIYHQSGEYNGHIKSYDNYDYSGLEIGTSNSKISQYGWPTGYEVSPEHPLTVRVTDAKFKIYDGEVLTKSWVADLDSFRYNAFEKIAIETPVFIARGNHDIAACRGSRTIERQNRNAYDIDEDTATEKIWAYYTNPQNNKSIPSSLNIIYQYPELGANKENNANYYIHDTDTDDIFIFFSLYTNDFWGGGANPYKDEDYEWLANVLNEFRNKRTFVFLHLFFDKKCGGYKHIYPWWGEGGNNQMYFNEQYLKLQRLSDYYKNSIWVSGHSHWRWCCQSEDVNSNVYHKTAEVNSDLGEYGGWCIHIPSCAYPRTDNGYTGDLSWESQRDIDDASEGGLIDIYKDYIELHGIVFKDNKIDSEKSRLSPNTPSEDYINYYSGVANYRLLVGGKNLVNVESIKDCLTVTAMGEQTLEATNMMGNSPYIEYSTDGTTWSQWDFTPISFNKDNPIYLRGNNPNGFSQNATKYTNLRFGTDSHVYIYGDIMNLISYENKVTEIPNSRCFVNLFAYCTQLVLPPYIGATIYKDYCFDSMYTGCTSLTSTSSMVDAVMGYRSCVTMYSNCTSLEYANPLPATILANNCYERMFIGCTSLLVQPEIKATKLADYCCLAMFEDCTSLQEAKTINVTECAPYCYDQMYHRCYSLTVAPELPATTLAKGCYTGMFHSCTSLEEGPALPATELVYEGDDEFIDNLNGRISWHCEEATALTEEQQAILADAEQYATIDQYNYYHENSESESDEGIDTGDDEFGIDSDDEFGISSDDEIEDDEFGIDAYSLDEENIDAQDLGDSETIEEEEQEKCILYYQTSDKSLVHPLTLDGWGTTYISNVYNDDYGKLTFSNPITYIPESVFKDNSILTYAGLPKDVQNISYYAFENCTSLNSVVIPECIEIINSYSFANDTQLTKVIYNDVEFTDYNRLNEAINKTNYGAIRSSAFENTGLTQNPIPTDEEGIDIAKCTQLIGCYAYMFYNCTKLKGIKNNILPATKLSNYCYTGMFGRCTSMTESPVLPAMEMKPWCYADMFYCCTGLQKCPELPATKLDIECYGSWLSMLVLSVVYVPYGGMFRGCTSISEYPSELPATNLDKYCYHYMFGWNYSMTNAPKLPALTLKNGCYENMFYNCTSLSKVELNATEFSGSENDAITSYTFNNVKSYGTISYYCTNSYFNVSSYLPSTWTKKNITPIGNTQLTVYYKTPTTIKNNIFPTNSTVKPFDNTIEIVDSQWDADTHSGNFTVSLLSADNKYKVGYEGFVNKNISEITLPSSCITTLESKAFYNCRLLTTINLDDALIEIKDEAFSNCASLTSITIPNNVTILGSNIFYNCTSLAEIIFEEGVHISYEGTGKYKNTPIESITLPEGVETIELGDFWGCTNLVTVNSINKIKTINKYAFYNCSNLKNIDLTEVTTINDNAFLKTEFDYFRWPDNCNTINQIFGQPSVTSYKFPTRIDFGNNRTIMPELYLETQEEDYLPFRISEDLLIIVPDCCYDDIMNDDNWTIYYDYIIKYTDYYNSEKSEDRIEIGMYVGAIPGYNKINYAGIKEMGIDWIYTRASTDSLTTNAITQCTKNNLGIYLDGTYDMLATTIKDKPNYYPTKWTETVKGFMVCDEPFIERIYDENGNELYSYNLKYKSSLEEVKAQIEYIKENDVNYNKYNRKCWVCAFPSYGQEGQITQNFYGYVYKSGGVILGIFNEDENGEYVMYYPDGKMPSCPNCTFVKKSEMTEDESHYSTITYSQGAGQRTDIYQTVTDTTYKNYIKEVANLDTEVICCDYYGIRESSTKDYELRNGWITSLTRFRELSISTGKPMWQYICSTYHNGYAQPSIDNLRFYININLMYGVEALIYFMNAEYNGSSWSHSPFDINGNKNDTFDYVKYINTNDLVNNGKFFKNATINTVDFYDGDEESHPFIKSFTGQYILTEFTKEGIKYFAIFNYGDSTNTITMYTQHIKYTIIEGKLKVYVHDESEMSDNTIDLSINQGDMRIFVVDRFM